MTKILLVEDDKSLREIYGVRLLAEGYDIVSAGDGEEALAMAIKERPVLIVSDVMMPKISGFDMLDILRSTTETKDIRVIMMTALSSEDQRERGEKLGADRYLVKSQVGIEDVVRTVHEVLGDLPGMTPVQPHVAQAPTPPATPAPTPVAMPAPQAPVAPVAAPIPATPPPVQAVPAPQPATTQAPASVASSLPQPTAPFSSSTPRPNSLGDRVIQPLQSNESAQEDVAARLAQELAGSSAPTPPATPAPTPVAMPAPQAPVAPVAAPIPATPPPVQAVPAPQPATTPLQPTPDVTRPDVASLSPQPQAQNQAFTPPAPVASELPSMPQAPENQ